MDLLTKIYRLLKFQARRLSSSSDVANSKAKMKIKDNASISESIAKKEFNLGTFLEKMKVQRSALNIFADFRLKFRFPRGNTTSDKSVPLPTLKSNLNEREGHTSKAWKWILFNIFFYTGIACVSLKKITFVESANIREENDISNDQGTTDIVNNPDHRSVTMFRSPRNHTRSRSPISSYVASGSSGVPSSSNTRPPPSDDLVLNNILTLPTQNRSIIAAVTQNNPNPTEQPRKTYPHSINSNSAASRNLVVSSSSNTLPPSSAASVPTNLLALSTQNQPIIPVSTENSLNASEQSRRIHTNLMTSKNFENLRKYLRNPLTSESSIVSSSSNTLPRSSSIPTNLATFPPQNQPTTSSHNPSEQLRRIWAESSKTFETLRKHFARQGVVFESSVVPSSINSLLPSTSGSISTNSPTLPPQNRTISSDVIQNRLNTGEHSRVNHRLESNPPRERSIALDVLQDFAIDFKECRIDFGFSHKEVAQQCGHNLSPGTISRFEELKLPYRTMCSLHPLLSKWLRGIQNRPSLVRDIIDTLEYEFRVNLFPSEEKITELAELKKVDREAVSMWFTNREMQARSNEEFNSNDSDDSDD